MPTQTETIIKPTADLRALGRAIHGKQTVYTVLALDTARSLVQVTPRASILLDRDHMPTAVHTYNGVDMGRLPTWRRAETFQYVLYGAVLTCTDFLALANRVYGADR